MPCFFVHCWTGRRAGEATPKHLPQAALINFTVKQRGLVHCIKVASAVGVVVDEESLQSVRDVAELTRVIRNIEKIRGVEAVERVRRRAGTELCRAGRFSSCSRAALEARSRRGCRTQPRASRGGGRAASRA